MLRDLLAVLVRRGCCDPAHPHGLGFLSRHARPSARPTRRRLTCGERRDPRRVDDNRPRQSVTHGRHDSRVATRSSAPFGGHIHRRASANDQLRRDRSVRSHARVRWGMVAADHAAGWTYALAGARALRASRQRHPALAETSPVRSTAGPLALLNPPGSPGITLHQTLRDPRAGRCQRIDRAGSAPLW